MSIKPFNSAGGYSVGDITVSNVILANGDITTNNITTTGVANLGNVSNVIITGGSANQFLQTNGSGNLVFASISSSEISNGNSNISIPSANGNVNISVSGNANVVAISGNTISANASLIVTGNANANHVNATSVYLTSTGTAVNASSGNILTNEVTGTKFNFLNGVYTATLTGAGSTGNYTLNLPPNAGSNGQFLQSDGNGNLVFASAGAALSVSEANANAGNIGNTTSNVSGLLFDRDSGFSVSNVGNGNVLIQLGSTFKTWVVDGQPNLVAQGEDTVQFIAGNNLVITTSNTPNPPSQPYKFIRFDADIGILSNGTSNISIPTANGNINFSSNGVANVLVVTSSGANVSNIGANNVSIIGNGNVLAFQNDSGNKVQIAVPNTIANNITFIAPNTTGTSQQVLGITDQSTQQLGWKTVPTNYVTVELRDTSNYQASINPVLRVYPLQVRAGGFLSLPVTN